MIRVIAADDHALILEGIKHLLSKTSDIRLVDQAANGKELLAKLGSDHFDVLSLDLSMPGMDAFELIRKIRNKTPELPILVVSMQPDKQFGIQAFKAGVHGYLNKANDLNDLVTAIRRLFEKKKYVSPSLASLLTERLADDSSELPHEGLSEREFQIMCLLAKGNNLSRIAQQLGLSVKTISTYRKRLLEKLELQTNAQLTYYAINNRLV